MIGYLYLYVGFYRGDGVPIPIRRDHTTSDEQLYVQVQGYKSIPNTREKSVPVEFNAEKIPTAFLRHEGN